jgi:hypothetical protein
VCAGGRHRDLARKALGSDGLVRCAGSYRIQQAATWENQNVPDTALPPPLDSHTLLVAAVIVHDRAARRILLLRRGPDAKFAPRHDVAVEAALRPCRILRHASKVSLGIAS